MKIKILTNVGQRDLDRLRASPADLETIAGENSGRTVEVADQTADRLVAAGLAQPVAEPKEKPAAKPKTRRKKTT